jgi:hypothetical protein
MAGQSGQHFPLVPRLRVKHEATARIVLHPDGKMRALLIYVQFFASKKVEYYPNDLYDAALSLS